MFTMSQTSKVGFASGVGTTVEWYDFFIYGTAAGLVFNKIFFPEFDSLIGTLLAFATFSAAFVARPIGGVVFGHFGDRIGRKSMLVITLTIMGFTTLGVGLLPSYQSIGVAAPIILVTLRFVQGSRSVARSAGRFSWPSNTRRRQTRLLRQLGADGGAGGIDVGQHSLPVYGRTFPRSVRILGLANSLPDRGCVRRDRPLRPTARRESPNFDRVKKNAKLEKLPIGVVLRHYPKQVLLTCGAYFAIGVTFYGTTVFGLSYGVAQVGYTRNQMLTLVLVAMAVTFVALPFFGKLSDSYGRKPVFLAGVVAMLLFTFPWFWLVNSGSFLLAMVGFVSFCLAFSTSYGPLAAFFAEAFDTRIRYTGISFGYTIGTLASSAPAPIVATYLLDRTGSYGAVALFMVAMCAISVVCVIAMRETYQQDLSDNDEAAGQERLSPTST